MDNEPARLFIGQEIPITTGESLGTNNSNRLEQLPDKSWNRIGNYASN